MVISLTSAGPTVALWLFRIVCSLLLKQSEIRGTFASILQLKKEETVMIIATWNVNSINVRLPHVLSWLEENRPTVLCLQETKMVDEKFPSGDFESLGYHCEISGQKTYNGVAIVSRKKPDSINREFKDDPKPEQKRFIEASFGDVQIMNVYIPNGSEVGSEKFDYKLEWLAGLKKHLQENHSPDQKLVLVGDFNVALEDRDVYDPEAMEGQILFSDREKEAVGAIMSWGLTDAFRIHEDGDGIYSWWDYRMNAFRRNMGLRIDHVWVTEKMAKLSKSCRIDKEERKKERPSDHAPVIAEFR